jgi:hypothetical protein
MAAKESVAAIDRLFCRSQRRRHLPVIGFLGSRRLAVGTDSRMQPQSDDLGNGKAIACGNIQL